MRFDVATRLMLRLSWQINPRASFLSVGVLARKDVSSACLRFFIGYAEKLTGGCSSSSVSNERAPSELFVCFDEPGPELSFVTWCFFARCVINVLVVRSTLRIYG